MSQEISMAIREVTEEELIRDREAVNRQPEAYFGECVDLMDKVFDKRYRACVSCPLEECRADRERIYDPRRCRVFRIVAILLEEERDFLTGTGENPCVKPGGLMVRGKY